MRRRSFIKLASTSALLHSACASVEPNVPASITPISSLSYRFDYGRRLIVQGSINGSGPYDFIVDTASTSTILFENVASPASVTPSGAPDILLLGFSGIRKTPTFKVGDIRIGNIDLKDHIAPILPDWTDAKRTPQGILGLDFFEGKIAVFDPVNKILNIYSSDAHAWLAAWSPFDLLRSNFGNSTNFIYIVNVLIEGRKTPFLLDSGTSATLCNVPAIEHLKTDPPIKQAARNKTELTDIHGDVSSSYIVQGLRLKIGSIKLLERPLLVADTPFFEQIGYKEKPFGLLGLDYLLQQPIAIDFTRHILFLKR